MATWSDFEKIEIRAGIIVEASLLEDAKYSTHKLKIDFGEEIGTKQSCARLVRYMPEELIGKKILAVTNFPPKQIGKNMSEVLTLGVPGSDGECVLIHPENAEMVERGARLY